MLKLSLIWPREHFQAGFCTLRTRVRHSEHFLSRVFQAHLVHSHPVQGADTALENIGSSQQKRPFEGHDLSDKYAHHFWGVVLLDPDSGRS